MLTWHFHQHSFIDNMLVERVFPFKVLTGHQISWQCIFHSNIHRIVQVFLASWHNLTNNKHLTQNNSSLTTRGVYNKTPFDQFISTILFQRRNFCCPILDWIMDRQLSWEIKLIFLISGILCCTSKLTTKIILGALGLLTSLSYPVCQV